jgi:hypothetical protein
MMTANVVDDTMSTLTDRSTYMGVAGVIVANVTGIALTMIPFYKAGRVVGNGLRVLTTLGIGSALLVRSQKMSADFAAASKTGGIVLIAYGLGQTLTLLNVPFFRNFAPLMMATESLPQSGSGSVIGQQGITPEGAGYSYSDIKNAEGEEMQPVESDAGTSVPAGEFAGDQEPFVAATLSMKQRGVGKEPMYSHMVRSPLGHGADFNLGAEEVSPTGGVEQAYGGGNPESSTTNSPVEDEVGAYINSVDVGGAVAEGLGGRNAFVASRYPGGASTQPPVSYGADTATMSVSGNAYATQTGSIYDEFGSYVKPGTSAESDTYLSHVMPSAGNSGRGVTFYYAEGAKTGVVGRHMVSAEGTGAVMGQY